MRPLLLTIAALLLLLATCLPAVAQQAPQQGVRGHVTLGYANYQMDRSSTSLNASHFIQQYAVTYDLGGTINGGRGGAYRLSLGYEFNALDFQGPGGDRSVDTGKLLYKGVLDFAPGALPLRLRLFSEDMRQSVFLTDQSLRTSGQQGLADVTEFVINPDIYGDLSNGSHRVSGATLMAGIRNGSYLGEYREMLSHLPRLLIDYRQVDVENMHTLSPEKWRQRDLAFISLNKKDNWFHYRTRDYADALQSRNDYRETELTLGSIDNNYVRQWINLTNWIKLSADGNYSTTNENLNTYTKEENRYDFNLFAITRRATSNSVSSMNYSRIDDGHILEKKLNAPVGMRLEQSPDTRVDGRLSYTQFNKEMRVPLPWSGGDFDALDRKNLYLDMAVALHRRQPTVVTPQLELETKGGNDGNGFGFRTGILLESNSTLRLPVRYMFNAAVAHVEGEGRLGGEVDMWEYLTRGALEKDFSSRLRSGVTVRLSYAHGSMATPAVDHIRVSSLDRSIVSSRITSADSMLHLLANWSTSYLSSSGLQQVFEAEYEMKQSDLASQDTQMLRYDLKYDREKTRSGFETIYLTGFANESATRGDTVESTSEGSNGNWAWTSAARYDYLPNRTWLVGAAGKLQWRNVAGKDDNLLSLSQKLEGNFFTVNGLTRKLARVSQQIIYEMEDKPEARDSGFFLQVAGEYYPTLNWCFGGEARYKLMAESEVNDFMWLAKAELDYAKVKFGLYYSAGVRTSSGEIPNQTERRFEAKVNKLF